MPVLELLAVPEQLRLSYRLWCIYASLLRFRRIYPDRDFRHNHLNVRKTCTAGLHMYIHLHSTERPDIQLDRYPHTVRSTSRSCLCCRICMRLTANSIESDAHRSFHIHNPATLCTMHNHSCQRTHYCNLPSPGLGLLLQGNFLRLPESNPLLPGCFHRWHNGRFPNISLPSSPVGKLSHNLDLHNLFLLSP